MNRLAEIIFKKSIDDVSAESLQQLTKKYPFFNAGHLLVAKKNQFENSLLPPEFLQKASLHFHPLFLNAILADSGKAKIILPKEAETIDQSTIQSEPETTSNRQQTLEEEKLAKSTLQIEISKVESTINSEHSTSNIEQQLTTLEEPDTHNHQSTLADLSTEILTEVEASADKPITNNEQPITGNEPLSFEPFHTVDYFASQGIKIKLDENATDKFSKQLKSFTEWLKTMKKLPTGETIAEPSTNTFNTIASTVETKVEQLAQTSLNKADVITEAMAEVWEKQGNPEKAIEIYQKLSLLEPSKSPYFATRISDLKKTN